MIQSSATNSDSLAFNALLINAMPGNHLVLLPNAPTFTIAAISDEYLAELNLPREIMVGYGVFEVFFSDAVNDAVAGQLMQSLTQLLQTKQAHFMPDQQHRWPNAKTGLPEWRTWRPVNKPVIGPDKEVIYIIHTIEDVTNALQLVEITEANRYLQTIINLLKEPLQVLQPVFEDGEIVDFRFKLTNQAYASYANATPEQLQGKRVGDVFPSYFETASFINSVKTYQTGQPLTFEIHYDKDGLDLYNLMSTSRLDDEVVIHFTDFTRLRQLQLQLESKIDELKRSNDHLQQFAYASSHDLQEPLRKIQQFGDLLRSSYAEELGAGLSYLERMQSAAGRMSVLIKDLLTFSRIGTNQAASQWVALGTLVEEALTDLELVVAETGAVIQVAPLPTVLGDRLQLSLLFGNLLSNALKFRHENRRPVITVKARQIKSSALPAGLRTGREVAAYHLIEVCDNGIGFDEKYTDRIFQVFQRLHGHSAYAGTGIGLAICEKVVTSHGGAITAHSQVGQGATFQVYLPA
ncbi:PAS domain-containing protein [Spirosoma taeanense]|uniref:histidine kinase n=1 Tax=Spirosoma taeanense TaxID=2735870 RepID=A0A6M5YBA6_9BACT|nr:ATP-binding protein [Spirosoma taeanense]QJW90172.1 PAS domain-containing protein [Spirosoma taeanense]